MIAGSIYVLATTCDIKDIKRVAGTPILCIASTKRFTSYFEFEFLWPDCEVTSHYASQIQIADIFVSIEKFKQIVQSRRD
jgi:hypothetical protein